MTQDYLEGANNLENYEPVMDTTELEARIKTVDEAQAKLLIADVKRVIEEGGEAKDVLDQVLKLVNLGVGLII